MGVSSSSLNSDGPSPPSKALHVLRVAPGSPAAYTDIQPFFDFVVGIDGDDLASNVDGATLAKLVQQHEGKTLPLLIWSAKYRNMRVVPVQPSKDWLQEAGTDIPPSLLGLAMRICTPEAALDNVWHILEVLENSPAEAAGLVPYGDWIIGWHGGPLTGENAFYELVEAHIDKPLRVIIYSYDFDAIREVVLVPNRKWGGEGLLGCGVGFGLLHRIPPQPANPEAIDTLIKQNIPYDEQDPFGEAQRNDVETVPLFVPADDDHFQFGGASGNVVAFGEEERSFSSQQHSPITHVTHSPTDHNHYHHHHNGHDHSHGDASGPHSHSHNHSPLGPSPTKSSDKPSRTDSISSSKSGVSESSVPTAPRSSPPRSSTPTLSGVPALSHTFSYREARNSIVKPEARNNIVKPEPLRRLSSPPAATASPRPRMRGGIVHSPAGSISGTPARVKSPEILLKERAFEEQHANDSDSTNRQPVSPGGSITSVD